MPDTGPLNDIFADYSRAHEGRRPVELTLQEYLDGCRSDPLRYASAAERMIAAIGEPEIIDTSRDSRLSRVFLNRTIKVYPAFADFFGMEETIERIVGYFRHAAQGLEERKQILYLLGPVGGGKSSLAERLKALMEKEPIYVLKAGQELSPLLESPLGLFDVERFGPMLEEKFGIPIRRLGGLMSPWAVKRLEEFGGDISRFRVVKLYPSRLKQIAVAKTEPGDDNNQDISTLVGKVDIRKLEAFSQNDPDAYSYSGGLNRCTQGLLEFVEMFKAPIKMLHPLITATQEGNYVGSENIGALPFTGIVLAHSNESEWQNFKSNRNNEAFIDRICVVKVPYCLRTTEEQKIYEKLIRSSDLIKAPCAPATLEMLARFCTLSRLKEHENSNLFSKMRVYDGENIKETDPKAKSMQEYRDAAGVDEGMEGISTRFAFKVLSQAFNYDTTEVAADPVHLMYMLEMSIRREQFPADTEKKYIEFIKSDLAPPLRRVHRQRDPEGLSRILQRLRPEPVRPLRRLRRRLGRRPGLQGSRHRAAAQPRAAEPGTVEDREARGHRQPQGFPQRGGEVRLAGAGPGRRQEPVLDLLREDPPGHRAADVQPGRGSAAGDQLRLEAGFGDREETHGVRPAH